MIHEILENNVLTIVIDRIDKKNALVPKMYNNMAVAIENAPSSNARVIVIKGAGDCFTAGNDVSVFAQNAKDAINIDQAYRFMKALLNCPLPVVAQVQGLAIGIGSTLLLHCDFVLCHEDTLFSMPFINLGLVPEYASSYILPRIAGRLQAAEILMLGATFKAKKALNCGLVNSIHGSDLHAAVTDIAEALAKKPAKALAQTKALLKHNTAAVSEHMDKELKIFVQAMQSEAANEAFTAFLEKRAINYDVFK